MAIAKQVIETEQQNIVFQDREIVTEVEMAKTFWRAEEGHQNYIERTGRPCHVNPARANRAINMRKR